VQFKLHLNMWLKCKLQVKFFMEIMECAYIKIGTEPPTIVFMFFFIPKSYI